MHVLIQVLLFQQAFFKNGLIYLSLLCFFGGVEGGNIDDRKIIYIGGQFAC